MWMLFIVAAVAKMPAALWSVAVGVERTWWQILWLPFPLVLFFSNGFRGWRGKLLTTQICGHQHAITSHGWYFVWNEESAMHELKLSWIVNTVSWGSLDGIFMVSWRVFFPTSSYYLEPSLIFGPQVASYSYSSPLSCASTWNGRKKKKT